MGSPNFARIKAQVLDICARIPDGSLSTFAAIGDELAVPAGTSPTCSRPSTSATRPRAVASRDRRGRWHRGRRGRGATTGAARRRRRRAAQGTRRDLDARFVHVALDADHRRWPSTPLERSPAG
jgi:alkylated DNA nucleotide flippase Atl1